MAIMDKITALLPARRDRLERSAAAFDAMALRDDVDRWIPRFFDEPGLLGITEYPGAHVPDVHETDKEILVKMEVPGFDREDIDLDIMNNELTISAECREEQQDVKDRSVAAARYARFVRRVPLPAGIDANRAKHDSSAGSSRSDFRKQKQTPESGAFLSMRDRFAYVEIRRVFWVSQSSVDDEFGRGSNAPRP